MPFVSNEPEEEKQDQQSPAQGAVAPVGGGGAVHLAPSSGVSSVGGGGTSGGGTATAPTGGQFASLNQYLSANQGQAAPLAGKITSGINQQYNTLAGGNTSTLNDINNQIAANATPANYNDTLSQEAANPVSFASNPGNVASFQNLLNASYSGPASAESTTGYTNQQNAINNAISTGQQATQTEAGRENLLTQNEATPTTGVTALNSSILSQSPEALGQVENAYQPFNGLLTNLNTGANTADQQIAAQQANASQASQASNAAINNQISGLNSNVNNEYNTLQNNYNAATKAQTDLTTALQNGQLPTAYGVDPGLQAFITNNINPWVSAYNPGQPIAYNFANAIPQLATTAAPTIQQAATAQDYAQAQAFQNLLGGLNTQAPASIIDASTANQAGTYNAPAMPTVNNKVLAGDIESELGSVPGQVAAAPYTKYLDLLAALQQYQGLPVTGGPWGPGFSNQPGNSIPTIA